MGGPSSEREISLKSGKAVSRALREKGILVVEIGEFEDIQEGIMKNSIDMAFIALHGRFGEDGQIQEILEKLNIPYTGSGIEASRLAMDKIASRRLFEKARLNTPPYQILSSDDFPSLPMFTFPVVIKPAREGSSIGLGLARNQSEYKRAVASAREHDQHILIEKYIPGRELTVGIFDDKPLPVIEIIPSKSFFDYEAKYVKGKSQFVVPAMLPAEISTEAKKIGLAAHQVLNCYAYSRADIILGEDGVLYILEVNSIPGFTSTSLLPQAAGKVGIDFPTLCLKLLDLALTRNNYKNKSLPGSNIVFNGVFEKEHF